MAGSVSLFRCYLFLSLSIYRVALLQAAGVPAIYVFGDSLVDVGNNNYLKLSLAKADFPHNGVDFPTKKPTGRFCNGKNAADFLAEKVGLPSSPPFLFLKSSKNTAAFKTGVSFASGGAGIFNETNQLFKQSIALTQQVAYYSAVYEELVQELGSSAAMAHLSKSIFLIEIGSNDIFGYFDSSDLQNKYTPQQYVDLMSLTFESQLKSLYDYGARKFVIVGVGVVGCTPSQRHKNKITGECNEEINHWALQYDEVLKSMLKKLKTEYKDFGYSYFDAYPAMLNFIQTPSAYGFEEVRAACCGLGDLNAEVPCVPISKYCSNRANHLFWDLYHPTQQAHSLFSEYIFDGPLKFVYPLTMKQLIDV